MYNSNIFPLLNHTALPVYRYDVLLTPKPNNKPQFYQILGLIAKRIMREEGKAVVSNKGVIESLAEQIESLNYEIEIHDKLKFNAILKFKENVEIPISNFEEYKLLVNRLIDIALTKLSDVFYKFHPDAPYIIRDEPYFDQDLIRTTGIIDSKKYYRSLIEFAGNPCVIIDRETELQSNQNLLVEIKSVQKKFEDISQTKINFYDPSKEFVEYVNSLIRGKAARVLRYPGPSIKHIKEITWDYRAKDKVSGNNESIIAYLEENYGIKNLDPEQPLIAYHLTGGQKQYHVPQLLSLGHTFHDLALRIPPWQRTQVWGSIQPDCKNQLQKTFELLCEIDKTLRNKFPKIYPKIIEMSKVPLDVSANVSTPDAIRIQFRDKELSVSPSYETEFYHKYSNKKIKFYDDIGEIKGLVHVMQLNENIEKFLNDLQKEFELRTGNKIDLQISNIDFEKENFKGFDFVLSIMDEQDKFSEVLYKKCKKIIQNNNSIVHQHVHTDSAHANSVMQIVMELVLKLGKNPWVLANDMGIDKVIGVHTYANPSKNTDLIFANIFDGKGRLIKQYDPIEKEQFQKFSIDLIKNNDGVRTLYLFSHDKYDLSHELKSIISQKKSQLKYTIVQIIDKNHLRIFETWKPKPVRRFGTPKPEEQNLSSIQSQEKAPQGVSLISNETTSYLLTGRTMELSSLKRGCPAPLQIILVAQNDDQWNQLDITSYILNLCMMSRASGHMIRMPSPIYYLHNFANYHNNFGVPVNEKFKQSIFYI